MKHAVLLLLLLLPACVGVDLEIEADNYKRILPARGYILDAETKEPVQGALIQLVQDNQYHFDLSGWERNFIFTNLAVTDEKGFFNIPKNIKVNDWWYGILISEKYYKPSYFQIFFHPRIFRCFSGFPNWFDYDRMPEEMKVGLNKKMDGAYEEPEEIFRKAIEKQRCEYREKREKEKIIKFPLSGIVKDESTEKSLKGANIAVLAFTPSEEAAGGYMKYHEAYQTLTDEKGVFNIPDLREKVYTIVYIAMSKEGYESGYLRLDIDSKVVEQRGFEKYDRIAPGNIKVSLRRTREYKYRRWLENEIESLKMEMFVYNEKIKSNNLGADQRKVLKTAIGNIREEIEDYEHELQKLLKR